MDKLFWRLFEETGDIKYFLLSKKMKESDKVEDSRREGTSSKRD